MQSQSENRLRFHLQCGTLVKLSLNNRSAKRLRAYDEFNNGVVMTNRNLFDDELFEIRIDKLVDKWSGSVEVGVTIHDPSTIPIPSTMTNMRTGTSMMSGRGILANGKGIRREYGNFNLDDLKVGDRIGLMRKKNGDLHYYINGLDQGVAVSNLPSKVWGVVDMYGRTVKVTIVDRDVNEEKNLITRLSNSLTLSIENSTLNEDLLEFHPNCGAHTLVINNNTVAYRPNALDDFNNGVVLTNRPLKPNELFEVRLDRLVTKWAGSIEIGVTTHRPGDIDYPLTMTNVHSGTWMMTGVGIMHNGTTVVNQYGVNLDTLRVGDRVGAMVKSNSSLYFYVNGVDQGEAAKNVPLGVFGVVDLYGQAAQITICRENNGDKTSPHKNNVRFFTNHGKNARIVPGSRGRTADRLYCDYEFSQSIVLVNQTLQDGELFTVSVDKLNDRWSGSIEVGVTTIPPNVLSTDLPNTMTDLDHDTWVLSGCTVMKDGLAIKYNYELDLDKVKVGSVVGVMRHNNGNLHYFLDNVDQGIACTNVPSHLYPVIDIYGRCTQVTIQSPPEVKCYESESDISCCSQDGTISEQTETGIQGQKDINLSGYLFGENIKLSDDCRIATRMSSFKGGLIISDKKLIPNELFQILIVKCDKKYAGSLRIGVINSSLEGALPLDIKEINNKEVWYFLGNQVWYNQSLVKTNYCPSLNRLKEGDRVGIKYTSDRSLHLYVNGCDQGVATYNIPDSVYAIFDLYGCHISAKVIYVDQDNKNNLQMVSSQCSENLSDISESVKVDTTINVLKRMTVLDEDMSECCSSEISYFIDESTYKLMRFNEWHGKNVRLSRDGRTATRTDSYNFGLTMTSDILTPNTIFQVEIQSLNKKWESSLMIGVSKISSINNDAPATALLLSDYNSTWVISGDSVYYNGLKMKSNYGPDLNYCNLGDIVGIMIDSNNCLKLFFNRIDYGVAATNIPNDCYCVIDLYGQCEQVSIVNPFIDMSPVDIPNMPLENDLLPDDVGQPVPSEEKAELEGDEKQSPAQEETDLADLTWMKTDKTNENVLVASGHDVRSRSAELSGWIDEEASTSSLKRSKIRSGKASNYYKLDIKERKRNEILKVLRLKQCQYFNLSLKIKTYLSIPDEFFLESGHTCYCDGCNLYTFDENKLSIETGWCKFLLCQHPKHNNLILDKWQSAYVGCSYSMIRNCLDNGTLIFRETETEHTVLYPYLKRTVCCQNIKHFEYFDSETCNYYKCHAAFEVMVEPGSFEIGELLPKSSKTECQQQISSLVIPKSSTKTVLLSLYFRFDRDIK